MNRRLAALEFLLATGVVLAHNVWRVVPNEVVILTVVAILSMRLRAAGWNWTLLGFHRPGSWRVVVGVALAAATLRIALGDFVIEPATAAIWPAPALPEGASKIAGNPGYALMMLGLVWSFAAFGEEIAYRGYLMKRGAEALGGATIALWIAAVASSALFGVGHFYQGPAGIVDSGMAGLILAAAYLVTGRNLWTCVLAHGFIDTFAVAAIYFGLYD
jgi:uncharacterized protein